MHAIPFATTPAQRETKVNHHCKITILAIHGAVSGARLSFAAPASAAPALLATLVLREMRLLGVAQNSNFRDPKSLLTDLVAGVVEP